jgi:hypothetical protein
METIKVPVREFRSGLASYLDARAPVAVTRHGHTVGFFIPTPSQTDGDGVALEKASAKVERLLAGRAVKVKVAAAAAKAVRTATPVKRKSAR